MTQTREREAAPLTTERAEQMLSRAGEQLGRLAGRATLRLRQTAQAFREEADHMDMSKSASEHQSARPRGRRNNRANQVTLEKAEELVDQLRQRVGHWTTTGGLQMRRALARLREDAEDMLVEAQNMRREREDKRKQAE